MCAVPVTRGARCWISCSLLEREFNEKCLVISGGARRGVLAYFVLPPRRPLVAAGVAVGTYVAIARDEQLFNCEEKLKPLGGLFGAVSGPFKPAVSNGVYGGGMAAPGPC